MNVAFRALNIRINTMAGTPSEALNLGGWFGATLMPYIRARVFPPFRSKEYGNLPVWVFSTHSSKNQDLPA
jgi:hypothetical protein